MPDPISSLQSIFGRSLTGREILTRDFSPTALGPLAQWPTQLTATLSLMLNCPAPMFLAWGPELQCFYNDTYRPILGYRLETALGAPFREVWGDIWDDIGPLVDATLGGETRIMTDMPLDLKRKGLPEESWWTFSYSPVFDDAGQIAGLLCVTNETTDRIVAECARAEVDERLQLSLSSGNGIGTWDWDVVNNRIKADHRFAMLYGVQAERAAEGIPIAEFFKSIHPDDQPRVQAAIEATLNEGAPFSLEYRLLQSNGSIRWLQAEGHCITDAQGRCVRFPGVSYDITKRVETEDALRAAKEERDFLLSLTARQRVGTDAETIIRLSAEELGKRLGAHRVGFYRLLGEDRLRHGANWTNGTLDPLFGEQPVSRFGREAERLRRAGKILIFSDSRHDNGGDLQPYADDGVLAGICVPLTNQGRWQAGIYVHHGEVRHWSAADIALTKEVAEMTWLAVERAEALLRLSQLVDRQQVELAETTSELANQINERAQAETQLRQLQKMEAVGQLTGGIAHDFNNMLALIVGSLNLVQRRLDRGDTDVRKFLDNAMDGAGRATALTQRLLAFSRQQPLSPEAVDGNRLVQGLSELLVRSLGETIKLETVLTAGLWKIKADPSQLENAIVNMAVNARDAMPDGGKLTIETSNIYIDDAYARDVEVSPGQYVQFAVTDTGTGMAPDVIARAFDPFFTTKGVGKGTGLGLSQVFGFVRQSGGHIRAYSELGHGTTFKMYLPRYWGEDTPAARSAPTEVRRGKSDEVILVVEDEDRVRATTVEALRELGYSVLHASSGPAALAMLERLPHIDLLFTDIVMPEMTGRQLADRLLEHMPHLKVLYTTGYTRNAVVHNGILDPGTNFLPKPFNLDQLALKVREVLDGL